MKQIRFMVVVSVAFIAVLASVNEMTKARIARNAEIATTRALLYAFNLLPEGVTNASLSATTTTAEIPWPRQEVLETRENRLRQVTIPIPDELRGSLEGTFLEGRESVTIYEGLDEQDNVLAYGLPLEGNGLWGTIAGFGVISADLEKMVGIDFTKQSETPGLGARIIEQEYKSYFRNLDLSGFYDEQREQPPIIMVKEKEQTNIEQSSNSVQSITGATQTSRGVLKMVNSNLQLYLKILQNYQQQAASA